MRQTRSSAASPPRPRTIEAVLLAVAVGVAVAAMDTWPTDRAAGPLLALSAFGTLAAVAHAVMRVAAPRADPLPLPLAVLLSGIGTALLYAPPEPERQVTEPVHTIASDAAHTQLLWLAAGLAVFAAVVYTVRDPGVLRRRPRAAVVGAVVLLLLPLVPGLGIPLDGSLRQVAVLGTAVQPVEFAKVLLVVGVAGYLAAGPAATARPRLVTAMTAMGVLCVGVVGAVMHDLGTATLLFGAFLAMAYAATRQIRWPLIGAGAYLAACAVAFPLTASLGGGLAGRPEPNSSAAVCTRDNAGTAPCGTSATAEGGITGSGMGTGTPGHLLPDPTEFALAGIAEEFGLAGLLTVLTALVFTAQRAVRAAGAAEDPFARTLAAGLACLIGLPVLLGILDVTRVLPMAGAAAPFVTPGASAALSSGIVLALLVRVAHAAPRTPS